MKAMASLVSLDPACSLTAEFIANFDSEDSRRCPASEPGPGFDVCACACHGHGVHACALTSRRVSKGER